MGKRLSVIFLVIMLCVLSCFTSCVNDKESTREQIKLTKDWVDQKQDGKVLLSHQVTIPSGWKNKCINFGFKYEDSVTVLLDGEKIIEKTKSLLPYNLDLSTKLKEGKHKITLITDSVFKNKNSFSGILEESDKTHIEKINILHNSDTEKVFFNLEIANPLIGENVKINLYVIKRISDIRVVLEEKTVTVPYNNNISIPYDLKNNYYSWNGKNMPNYSVLVSIESNGVSDSKKKFFGIKDIKIVGNEVFLNNKAFKPLMVKLKKADINEKKITAIKSKGFNTLLFDDYIPSSDEFNIIDKELLLMGLEIHKNLSLKQHSQIIDGCESHTAFSFYLLDNASSLMLDSLKTKYPEIVFSLNKKTYLSFNKETGYIAGEIDNENELFYNISNYKPYNGNNIDFNKASDSLSNLCYKNEFEKALLQNKYLGFIFDNDSINTSKLNLDKRGFVFLDLKNYNFRKSQVLNSNIYFSGLSMGKDTILWKIINNKSKVLKDSSIIVNGSVEGLKDCGTITLPLGFCEKAQSLRINLSIKNTSISNTYEVNVYPGNGYNKGGKKIYVSRKLNMSVINSAKRGSHILLMPDAYAMYNKTFKTSFSNRVGSNKTQGLFIQKNHPIFKYFPTNSFASWQWKSIIEEGRALKLDSVSDNYAPIVSVIDNEERGYNLAWICEFKMGEGAILICMTNLYNLPRYPEAIQLYNSIIEYMKSSEFKPTEEISENELKKMLNYTYTK